MSPSLRSRLLVFLGPDRIGVYALGRGLNPKLVTHHLENVAPPAPGAGWQVLAQKLAEVLALPEFQAARADVVLSNKLARHALVPYDAVLKKPAEREMFARHVLSQTFGSAVADWELRLSHQKGGSHWIVSAVDRALVEAIRQVFASRRVKLCTIRPRLALAYNHHRNRLAAEPAWLILREGGYSLLARLEAGRIVSLASARHDGLDELPTLLDRENLSSGQNESCRTVYLVGAEDEAAAGLQGGAYQITVLDPIPLGKLSSGGVSLRAPRRALPGRLSLDFYQPAQQVNRRAGWMLLAAGALMVADMGISYARATHERLALAKEMAAAHLSPDGAAGSGRGEKLSEVERDAARQMAKRLHTPWEDLFTGLESISNSRAAILSVAPDMQNGMVRVSGIARDHTALLTLLAQLRQTKPFSGVYLVSQEAKPDDPQHLQQFVVQMQWDGLR